VVAAVFAGAWSSHKKEATINWQPAMMLLKLQVATAVVSSTLWHMEKVMAAKQWQHHRQNGNRHDNKFTGKTAATYKKATINQQQWQ